MILQYDIIVVGAGHAGCEAAISAAKLGCKVLLTSINIDNIALMPCNPAVGGPAKSNLTREIDALGGVMGLVADASYTQMKTLNSSRGPAVHALRAQSDRKEYMAVMRNLIEAEENLHIKQCTISELLIEKGRVVGAVDELGIEYRAGAVVLTTGTSLKGKIFIGLQSFEAGRLGEFPANSLSESLKKNGIHLGRLKTGTPPRIDARSLDFDRMIIQPGDEELSFFSFEPNRPVRKQIPCYLTRTNQKTHEIILNNLHQSPLYNGLIEGKGPRYCPSIEDKVKRFSDKESHHIFIEPEGVNTYEIYVQGFSTSLPVDVQYRMLQSMKGLENVVMIKPAYAVEYDYVPAVQLNHTLMTKSVQGLFSAGQINGTSGYEEAAAQGLIAGINAVKFLSNEEMLTLSRSNSYIGTLIDDLVTKDIDEPYRMLTSRSEYRLILRQDNADMRLTEIGYKAGLIKEDRWNRFQKKKENIEAEIKRLNKTVLKPSAEVNEILANYNETLTNPTSLANILKRHNINYEIVKELHPATKGLNLDKEVCKQAEIEIMYEGYIKRQLAQIDGAEKMERIKLPKDIDYNAIKQLSLESQEKLSKIRPATLAQASRIAGVTPADISVLMVIL